MALGKKIIEFNDTDIVRGMSTSPDTSDGGFSSETTAVNLINTPGVAYGPALITNKSDGGINEFIASCEDPNILGNNRLFVTNTGQFVKWTGTTNTIVATDATRAFVFGKTDMASFGLYTYVTSATYVAEWQVSSNTVTQTFFAFPSSSGSFSWSQSSVPHPVLVYEGNIFYGNGPQLLRQATVGGTPAEILLLNGSQVITALGIDPGSGKMLISTTTSFNASDTINYTAKVHYYDGFSNKTAKTVVVDEMITAFYPLGATVYIGYGKNLGYWNGSGIVFLRRLVNLTYDSAYLPYKHHFSNIGNTLYLVEAAKILAYGPVKYGGGKVFYYAYDNAANGNIINIANLGQDILGITFATSKFWLWSVTSVSTIGASFSLVSSNYYLPSPFWIRRIRIWFRNPVAASAVPGTIALYDGLGNVVPGGANGIYSLINNTTGSTNLKEILNINAKVDIVNFKMVMDTIQPGVKRVVIYGDPAEIS